METNNKRSAIDTIDFIVLGVMALLSLTPLIGVGLSGINVIIGLVYFFVQKRVRKLTAAESGLEIRTVPAAFAVKSTWLWVLLPLVVDICSVMLSKWIAPEYLNHVFARSAGILSYDNLPKLIGTVFVLALGEEIAFRVVFQGTIRRYMKALPAILITSLFFALAHLTFDTPAVVAYDLVFVFINSIVYGIAFEKTKNGYISTIAHILSNLFGVLLIMMR